MTDMLDLLGGAKRIRTRVRGFAPWSPKEETLHLIGQVREVLREYAPYLPLTLRQIFYRLVGAHDYEKTEQASFWRAEHVRELGGEVTFTRLAVTPDQITRYRLDTALAPNDLATIVRQAIEQRIDQAVLDGVLRREKRERAKLRRFLDSMKHGR